MTKNLPLTRRNLLKGVVAASALPMILNAPYAQAQAAKRGGTLTIVSWPAPTYLNSGITTSGPETLLGGKMFDGLVDYDIGYVPAPALAESWDISEDGLTITFHLRAGVKWHDGEPFTSEDVAFTIMEILKVHHGRGRSTFANVTEVRTPDELTATLVLSAPAPALMKALNASESPMMPAHIYAGADIMENPANTAPIGTGAYRLAEYNRGESIVMEANPDYWDEGKPHIDKLVVRYVADGSTRAAMLETGEADLIASSLIPPIEILRLGAMPEFEVTQRGYEVSSSMHLMDFNLRHEILGNKLVRQAFAHFIDRDWITQNIWFGFGQTATGPMPPAQGDLYTAEGVPAYPYDLERAEALLDEAGYPRGDNGIRFSLFIDPLPYGEEPLRASEYIKQQAAEVGIELAIRTADMGGFVKRIYGDQDFDISTFTGSAGIDPTIGVHRFYWSKNIRPGVSFSNGSGYSNPEVDALLEQATVEIDPEKRAELYHTFQRLVMEDVPTLPLTATERVTIARIAVKDHTPRAIGPFGTLADVWLDR
ncbi:ABC transporter substrate-binding protein [Poseidonocella sp. HB161398]|uniref:ABC transporter substrate-binding protein n=1 Tax=Poseidonocella sp. HB161398 TaxID=2320855 RepID=UPI001107B318|nr:ABC transporter substrate-binding protein [Poseidonocella sp. HB161398]